MTADELQACGIVAQPLLAVIRAKCLDCVGHNAAEVRRCGDIACPNWPYRMSANPFHRRELSEEQRAAAKARGKRLASRSAQLRNQETGDEGAGGWCGSGQARGAVSPG